MNASFSSTNAFKGDIVVIDGGEIGVTCSMAIDESEIATWTTTFVREFRRSYSISDRSDGVTNYINPSYPTFTQMGGYYARSNGTAVKADALTKSANYCTAVIKPHAVHAIANAIASGIVPQPAALESLVSPTVIELPALTALSRSGTLEILSSEAHHYHDKGCDPFRSIPVALPSQWAKKARTTGGEK